ncbi:hypothetical protein [Oligoflexus tunisiensis]|uniref:hypothetical protein n=1 Tax=Oligoflexus tunisiensis TaxID=708132 RepID=UPI001FE03825|nr:hypothetical protein [Oligoflexus tunisiensis]
MKTEKQLRHRTMSIMRWRLKALKPPLMKNLKKKSLLLLLLLLKWKPLLRWRQPNRKLLNQNQNLK